METGQPADETPINTTTAATGVAEAVDQEADEATEEARDEDVPTQRRLPRRSAAVLANKEFTHKAAAAASSSSTAAQQRTRVRTRAVRPIRGLRPRGRPSKHAQTAFYAAKKKAR